MWWSQLIYLLVCIGAAVSFAIEIMLIRDGRRNRWRGYASLLVTINVFMMAALIFVGIGTGVWVIRAGLISGVLIGCLIGLHIADIIACRQD